MLLFSSCQETKRIFISSHLSDCVGVAPQKCLLYKENRADKWSLFYDTIEGFEYEEGYAYEIEVVITKIENPPADSSSLRYTLIKVVSKEKDDAIAQNTSITPLKKQHKIINIEYEALSMASFFQVNLSQNLIEKAIDRDLKNVQSKKCSDRDWNSILSLLKNINLQKIHELKSPTEKRFFDGAPHAQLKIISQTNTFTSAGFDHGYPPKEIQQLVNTILSLAESIE